MVVWIIGMSASGKTTIGRKLFEKLQLSDEKWLFLDGDLFRNMFGEDLKHTVNDRRKNAYRISRFCEYLNSQGVNVLACVLSIFHDNQRFNRERISSYKEVYIDVEFEKLVQRDNKNIYKKALNGKLDNVVGVDIEFKPPYSPDLVIDNNSDCANYNDMIKKIMTEFNIKLQNDYSYTKKDLLKYPHKYQYSRFEGEDFYKTFFSDRKKTLDSLGNKIKRMKIGTVDLKITSFLKEDSLVLKSFLLHLYSCNSVDILKENFKIMELLIKRFEVSKKLYLSYNAKDMKKSSLEYSELLNYPLFSLVLQKYYYQDNTQQRYVYLNAVLKVNDIISSIENDLIMTDEIFYSNLAIKGEVALFEKIV
jgi:cytidine diphosphoramidate kinase